MLRHICRPGIIRTGLRAILFGAFAQPKLAGKLYYCLHSARATSVIHKPLRYTQTEQRENTGTEGGNGEGGCATQTKQSKISRRKARNTLPVSKRFSDDLARKHKSSINRCDTHKETENNTGTEGRNGEGGSATQTKQSEISRRKVRNTLLVSRCNTQADRE